MLPLLTPTKTAERVTIRLNTEIVSAEEAVKQANVWLLFHVGNLLLAENPELRFLPTRNQLHWQVEVWLTRPTIGRVAQIGTLNINAQTGDPLPTPTLIETLQQRATHATVQPFTYRRPGSAQHLNIVMADDFDEPLSDFAL